MSFFISDEFPPDTGGIISTCVPVARVPPDLLNVPVSHHWESTHDGPASAPGAAVRAGPRGRPEEQEERGAVLLHTVPITALGEPATQHSGSARLGPVTATRPDSQPRPGACGRQPAEVSPTSMFLSRSLSGKQWEQIPQVRVHNHHKSYRPAPTSVTLLGNSHTFSSPVLGYKTTGFKNLPGNGS